MAPGQPVDLLSREDSDWPHTGKRPPVPAGIRDSELLGTLHGPPSSRATAPQSTALPKPFWSRRKAGLLLAVQSKRRSCSQQGAAHCTIPLTPLSILFYFQGKTPRRQKALGNRTLCMPPAGNFLYLSKMGAEHRFLHGKNHL